MTTVMAERTAGGPAGRDAVVAAVLAAAAELYAAKGPAATSIREVASRCGVNHGLVFRYFGAKEQLVGATLEHLGRRVAELIDQQAPVEQIEAALTVQSTVMARALLEGFPVGDHQHAFPSVTLLLEHLLPLFDSEQQARLSAANVVALQLGWRLFGPFLRVAAGLEDVPDTQLRDAILTATGRLIEQRSA